MDQTLYNAVIHDAARDAPVLFAFHGTGGSAQQIAALAHQIAPSATIIAPQGDVREHGAARFFRRTAEGVYDMADLAERSDRMAAFMAAHLLARPGRAAFAFGYSNGANILAAVLMRRPDLIDRAGLLHPLIPWSPAPVPGLSGRALLITAGQHDPICPWPLTQALIDWAQTQGAAVTTEIHAGGHELRPQELTALASLFQAATPTARPGIPAAT